MKMRKSPRNSCDPIAHRHADALFHAFSVRLNLIFSIYHCYLLRLPLPLPLLLLPLLSVYLQQNYRVTFNLPTILHHTHSQTYAHTHSYIYLICCFSLPFWKCKIKLEMNEVGKKRICFQVYCVAKNCERLC